MSGSQCVEKKFFELILNGVATPVKEECQECGQTVSLQKLGNNSWKMLVGGSDAELFDASKCRNATLQQGVSISVDGKVVTEL